MVTRQFRPHQFESVCEVLQTRGHREPLDSFYTVYMNYDDIDYFLRIHMDKNCRLVVLQGLRRDMQMNRLWEPIQRNSLLSALLEVLVTKGLE